MRSLSLSLPLSLSFSLLPATGSRGALETDLYRHTTRRSGAWIVAGPGEERERAREENDEGGRPGLAFCWQYDKVRRGVGLCERRGAWGALVLVCLWFSASRCALARSWSLVIAASVGTGAAAKIFGRVQFGGRGLAAARALQSPVRSRRRPPASLNEKGRARALLASSAPAKLVPIDS